MALIVHTLLPAALLGLAVLLCLAAAVGVLLSRNPYQRLNFSALVTAAAGPLVGVALFLTDHDAVMRIKTALCVGFLFAMGGVLGHVTARASFIRRRGRWGVEPGDRISLPDRG